MISTQTGPYLYLSRSHGGFLWFGKTVDSLRYRAGRL